MYCGKNKCACGLYCCNEMRCRSICQNCMTWKDDILVQEFYYKTHLRLSYLFMRCDSKFLLTEEPGSSSCRVMEKLQLRPPSVGWRRASVGANHVALSSVNSIGADNSNSFNPCQTSAINSQMFTIAKCNFIVFILCLTSWCPSFCSTQYTLRSPVIDLVWNTLPMCLVLTSSFILMSIRLSDVSGGVLQNFTSSQWSLHW